MGPGPAPSLARLAGIHAVQPHRPGCVELALGDGCHGLLDVAMLADFALGAAVRAQVGRDQPLPTLTLTLEFERARFPPGLSVRAWSEPVRSSLGRAQGVLVSDGVTNGQCCATFTIPADAARLDPLPWEAPGSAVPAAVHEQPGSSEALLAAACSASGSSTTLRPAEAMLNRSRQVQGAVVFRLAASLPAALTGDDARLVSGHLQFLAPAGSGLPVSAHPEVLGEKRRTLFVRTEIRQGDRLVAAGSFVFRRG